MDFTSPASKVVPFSVREFFQRFPDDEACLEHIMRVRFGMRHTCRKCGVESTFHRMENRRAWACANCGDHVYPTAGTIFQDTRTPLVSWFYAIYLFVTTRHGVSGKELQRQLGVTYKTAYRMGMQIRKLITSMEGFWRMFKVSVRSTHIHISPEHMQAYLNEFAFRSNRRWMKNAMFDLLIGAI